MGTREGVAPGGGTTYGAASGYRDDSDSNWGWLGLLGLGGLAGLLGRRESHARQGEADASRRRAPSA
jgi:hypothetical protein